MAGLTAIRVGLDPRLAQWGPEVRYVFRTLLRVAGFPCEFVWADAAQPGVEAPLDIYYGLENGVAASVRIAANGRTFRMDSDLEPQALVEGPEGLAFLDWDGDRKGAERSGTTIDFHADIIFGSHWLLTGPREQSYSRDRWDNLDLTGSFFVRHSLAARPLVSMYGAFLRHWFVNQGRTALDFPWTGPASRAAFCFTHDVDYPQMIRWIESLRLLTSRGLKSWTSLRGVWNGTNHFWKFAEWVEFEKQYGTRPAFYFMARRGSLVQYALGRPDAFYDIRSPEFRRLLQYLNEEGCEIGLHASYESWQDAAQIRRERILVEEMAGVEVEGNRHHYWHLNPAAPHETLRLHEQAGLSYDSSLGLEFYPGFRRGICHPFHVFDPAERRELSVVQLPPTWMDDHFDRRLIQNRITDPIGYARSLADAAAATGGVVVVDYHARGMNEDFYPRYGRWLRDFTENHLDSSFACMTPKDVARRYLGYEKQLAGNCTEAVVGHA